MSWKKKSTNWSSSMEYWLKRPLSWVLRNRSLNNESIWCSAERMERRTAPPNQWSSLKRAHATTPSTSRSKVIWERSNIRWRRRSVPSSSTDSPLFTNCIDCKVSLSWKSTPLTRISRLPYNATRSLNERLERRTRTLSLDLKSRNPTKAPRSLLNCSEGVLQEEEIRLQCPKRKQISYFIKSTNEGWLRWWTNTSSTSTAWFSRKYELKK